MFEWLKSRSRRREPNVVAEPSEADRDSGEDERESEEEAAREASASGLTQIKTDNI